ncbi:MAG: hypothetical protein IPK79_11570 [Vampirovibrionales bacterium]|nr:hypothetical protein [Vampirovibrionales bacterium]
MEFSCQFEQFLGPLGGLILSLFFCFVFLRRFEKATERLLNVLETELELSHYRHDQALSELMKLIEKHQTE